MTTFNIQYASTAEQSLYSQIIHLPPFTGIDGAEKTLKFNPSGRNAAF